MDRDFKALSQEPNENMQNIENLGNKDDKVEPKIEEKIRESIKEGLQGMAPKAPAVEGEQMLPDTDMQEPPTEMIHEPQRRPQKAQSPAEGERIMEAAKQAKIQEPQQPNKQSTREAQANINRVNQENQEKVMRSGKMSKGKRVKPKQEEKTSIIPGKKKNGFRKAMAASLGLGGGATGAVGWMAGFFS